MCCLASPEACVCGVFVLVLWGIRDLAARSAARQIRRATIDRNHTASPTTIGRPARNTAVGLSTLSPHHLSSPRVHFVVEVRAHAEVSCSRSLHRAGELRFEGTLVASLLACLEQSICAEASRLVLHGGNITNLGASPRDH